MNVRFRLVTAIAFAISVALASFSLWLLIFQPGMALTLATIPVGLLAGTAGFAAFSYRMQARSRTSAFSLALNRRPVTSDLLIGSIARDLLLRTAAASDGSGPRYVEQMERLAVSHFDRMRLDFESSVGMTGTSLDVDGRIAHQENGRPASGSLSIAADDEQFVIRRGEPSDPVAIIDGKDRLLIIRHQLPETVRQSMIEKARGGPFPLHSVIEVEGLGEHCVVEAVHMNQNEVHLMLRPDMVPWSEVRLVLNPEYHDRHTLPRRLMAVLRSAWKIGS